MNESYKCDFWGEISNDEIWYSSIFLTRDFFFNLEKSECLLWKEKRSSEKCDHHLLLSLYGS